MLQVAKALLLSALFAVFVLGWGFWYSLRHADVQFHVDDYALSSQRAAYESPHNVTLSLRDRSNRVLAIARSVEPQGFILAVHPDSSIGNCQPTDQPPSAADWQAQYSACYEKYSRWSARWAPLVHSADVVTGSCALSGLPVAVRHSNDDWLLWWLPLPHVGGLPRQYFGFSVSIDSRSCSHPLPSVSGASRPY
jgi:hypothetical protein